MRVIEFNEIQNNPTAIESFDKELSQKQLTILLIDDDPVFSAILRKIAHASGHAVKYLESTRSVGVDTFLGIDVLICDYELPSITGLQVADFIKRFKIQIPMVLISSYSSTAKSLFPDPIKIFVHKWEGHQKILNAAIEAYKEKKS